MSGQATGWVLRHGPKDRAMRAVLITIADAANRDGEHAHPGLDAMIEGSLYHRSHVLATVKRLIEGRWLEIEEEGVGRGHATVYRVCLDRPENVQPVDLSDPESEGGENVQPVDPSAEGKGPTQVDPLGNGKGPIHEEKRSNPDPEKVQSGQGALITPTNSTVNNGCAREDRNHPEYGFERFWARYPRRDGQRGSKKLSLELWRKFTYPQKAEAWRQLDAHYVRICEAGRPPMDAERWLRRIRDQGFDAREGWSYATPVAATAADDEGTGWS